MRSPASLDKLPSPIAHPLCRRCGVYNISLYLISPVCDEAASSSAAATSHSLVQSGKKPVVRAVCSFLLSFLAVGRRGNCMPTNSLSLRRALDRFRFRLFT